MPGPPRESIRYRPTAVGRDPQYWIVARELVHETDTGEQVVSITPHAVVAFVGTPTIRLGERDATQDYSFGVGPGETFDHRLIVTEGELRVDELSFDLGQGDLVVISASDGGVLQELRQDRFPDTLLEPVFVRYDTELLTDRVRSLAAVR